MKMLDPTIMMSYESNDWSPQFFWPGTFMVCVLERAWKEGMLGRRLGGHGYNSLFKCCGSE